MFSDVDLRIHDLYVMVLRMSVNVPLYEKYEMKYRMVANLMEAIKAMRTYKGSGR